MSTELSMDLIPPGICIDIINITIDSNKKLNVKE